MTVQEWLLATQESLSVKDGFLPADKILDFLRKAYRDVGLSLGWATLWNAKIEGFNCF